MVELFGYILVIIFNCIFSILDGIEYVLIAYIILSWIVVLRLIRNENSLILRIYIFMASKIEPILGFIRRYIPPIAFFDFAIVILIMCLHIAKLLLYALAKMFLG